MSSSMSKSSIKERDDVIFEEVADVSGATAFLLQGTEEPQHGPKKGKKELQLEF